MVNLFYHNLRWFSTLEVTLILKLTKQIFELESARTEIEGFRDILRILSEVLESDECSDYAKQYSAIALAALNFTQTTCDRLNKVIDQLSSQTKESVA